MPNIQTNVCRAITLTNMIPYLMLHHTKLGTRKVGKQKGKEHSCENTYFLLTQQTNNNINKNLTQTICLPVSFYSFF